MTTTVEDGTVIEITVLGLDGRRLLIRGITDGPIRLRSAAVIPMPTVRDVDVTDLTVSGERKRKALTGD